MLCQPRGGFMQGLRSRITRRRTRNCHRIFCVAVAAAAGLAGLVTPAVASTQPLQASLYLTPSTGSPHVGDELDVQIRLNSGSQSMGSVEAILTYPVSQLSVLGFDTITSSWPTQGQAVSNGLIKVVGVAFTPVS